MKALLILTISCITLALCHGSCFRTPAKLVIENGIFVEPDGCIDPSDNSKHALGSAWNTENCQSCTCDSKGESECCSRYGGIQEIKGCKSVADPETCTYKFYKADDPSVPCPGF